MRKGEVVHVNVCQFYLYFVDVECSGDATI